MDYGLVSFFLVGEIPVFHVMDIAGDGLGDDFMEVGIAAQEPGLEFLVNAQHIMDDQHLAIHVGAGANADDGDA